MINTGTVAPFVGAWIEIALCQSGWSVFGKSLPSWERGLKYIESRELAKSTQKGIKVAPFVGAWIEIMCFSSQFHEYPGRSLRGSVD